MNPLLIQYQEYLMAHDKNMSYINLKKGEIIELIEISIHTVQFKRKSNGETFRLLKDELDELIIAKPLTEEDLQMLLDAI